MPDTLILPPAGPLTEEEPALDVCVWDHVARTVAWLDAANGQIVIDTLRRIAHTHDTTVLCVSHDPRLVTHADRVLEMEDGAILSDRRLSGPSNTLEMRS